MRLEIGGGRMGLGGLLLVSSDFYPERLSCEPRI
jgi:hypothetical protein